MVAVAGLLALRGSAYSSPGEGTFVADFEVEPPGWQQFDGLLYEEDRPLGDSFALVSHPVRQGRAAVRMIARQGYSRFGEEESSALVWSGGEDDGDDYWYAWSTLFPVSWRAPFGWGIFAEWHANLATSPIIGFSARGDFAELTLLSGLTDEAGNTATTDRVLPLLATLSKGRWNDFVMHVEWTPEKGVVEVFHRLRGDRSFRKLVALRDVPTLQMTQDGRGRGAYLLLGIYRRSFCSQPTELGCVGAGGRIQRASVLYHDGFVRARSFTAATAAAFGDRAQATPPADAPATQVDGSILRALRIRAASATRTESERDCAVRSATAPGGIVARVAAAADDRDTAVRVYSVRQRTATIIRQRLRLASRPLGGRLVLTQVRATRGTVLAELSVGPEGTLHLSSPPAALSPQGFDADTGVAYGPAAAPRTVELRLMHNSVSVGVDGRRLVLRAVAGPPRGERLQVRIGIERYDARSATGPVLARYESVAVGAS